MKGFAAAILVTVALGLPSMALAARAHAICRDGTISYSIKRSGTCSWHHGVKKWLY
jgi:hypothetical protein